MAATGFVFHPLFLQHLTGPHHPERPERVLSIRRRLQESGVLAELDCREPEAVDTALLEPVHDSAYIRHVRQVCGSGAAVLDAADTADRKAHV